jgi:carbamoyl-phosphate synthase large subunit
MLITGCGGDIAQSLARIVRERSLADRLIGCDIGEDRGGKPFFDACICVPRASQSDYLPEMTRVVSEYDIDAIVPMSEAEIARFLDAGAMSRFGSASVIAANEEAAKVGLDKLATVQMLDKRGLNPPWTRIVGTRAPDALPCIIKPRVGRGSKGVSVVRTGEEVEKLTRSRAGDLWQELLLPDDEEYTCGLFRSRLGEVRTITFRRKLNGGLTQSGEVVTLASIDALLGEIAAALNLVGSINVQLRLTDVGPRVFEINPRFSSTVAFRHKLGFRDFIWALQDRENLDLEPYVPPRPGIRFYRSTTEIIVQ